MSRSEPVREVNWLVLALSPVEREGSLNAYLLV